MNDAVLLRTRDDEFWLSPGDGDVLPWVQGPAVHSGMDVEAPWSPAQKSQPPGIRNR